MASDTPLTLQSLLTPPTAESCKARILTDLDAGGFAATSWQEGQPELAIVETVAEIDAERMSAVSTLVRWCFFRLLNDDEGDVAEELARSWYGVTRHPATFAERTVTLVNTPGAGPYTAAAGDFALSGGGQIFRNTSTLNIPATAGAQVTITMRAEVAGIAGNVSALRDFVTPLAGVSILSQAVTTVAVDAERVSDLRTRCEARWGTLAINGELPRSGYVYAVTTANPLVTRAKVRNDAPDGAGSFRVYIARLAATAQASDVTSAQATVDAIVPPCVTSADVYACPTYAVTLSGGVLFASGYDTTDNRAAVELAARAYVEQLPIGGVLRYSELIAAMTDVAGVESVSLTAPTADVTPGVYDVFVVTYSITYSSL